MIVRISAILAFSETKARTTMHATMAVSGYGPGAFLAGVWYGLDAHFDKVAERRVKACMDRLDVCRSEWRRQVNRDTLDIGCPQNCAFGQIFGEYRIGLSELGIPKPYGKYYGVHATMFVTSGRLTRTWRRLLAA